MGVLFFLVALSLFALFKKDLRTVSVFYGLHAIADFTSTLPCDKNKWPPTPTSGQINSVYCRISLAALTVLPRKPPVRLNILFINHFIYCNFFSFFFLCSVADPIWSILILPDPNFPPHFHTSMLRKPKKDHAIKKKIKIIIFMNMYRKLNFL